MPLDSTQQQKANAWLSSHRSEKCPICKTGSMEAAALAIAPQRVPGYAVEGTDNVPLLVIACPKCAHVEFLSARVMGLL